LPSAGSAIKDSTAGSWRWRRSARPSRREQALSDARPVKRIPQLVRTGEVEWRPLVEPGVTGVSVKVLRFDTETRRAPTILLEFEPGATYPAHNHPGGEEIFVLEGDITVGQDHLKAGDYIFTPPQGKHAVRSEGGCVVLVNIPEEVEILKPRTRATADHRTT
jgi:quercetin dioxygenase-like cupin family protein